MEMNYIEKILFGEILFFDNYRQQIIILCAK